MTATQSRPRRSPRQPQPAPTRPVTEILLELAYYLHTTRPAPRSGR